MSLAHATEEKKKKVNHKFNRDKDRQIVRGKFIFHEVPGGCMSFSVRLYKEDPVENYTMFDGEIYSIPLGVAKHLNKNLAYPIHQHIMDEDGKPKMQVKQMIRRASFQSLEFIDEEDLTPVGSSGIVTVENVR